MFQVRRVRGTVVSLGVLVALLGVLPAAASAQAPTTGCDATALRLTLLGGTPIAPVSANVGAPECRTAEESLLDLPGGLGGLGTLLPLEATVVEARTVAGGTQADAEARIAGLRVGTQGAVGALLAPVRQNLGTTLQGVTGIVDLTLLQTLLNTLTLGSAGTLSLDLDSLVDDITGQLATQIDPTLLGADVISAHATARCAPDGAAGLSGSSQVLGLTVLGQGIDTNQAVNQVAYIDAQNLDLGTMLNTQNLLDGIHVEGLDKSLQQVIDDLGLVGAVLNQVTGLVDDVVGSLPTISIPQQLLEAHVAPNQQTLAAGALTRTGLHVELGLLTEDVLDGVLAEARVSAAGVDCAAPTNPDPTPTDPGPDPTTPTPTGSGDGGTDSQDGPGARLADQALQCTSRRLVLIDVVRRGRRVRLTGAADRRYAGRRVRIRFKANGKTVARPKVRASGLFRATTKLPPRRIRHSNRARYQASIRGHRSKSLKLTRRMRITKTVARATSVTIRGRVVHPHHRGRAIRVKRRVSCRDWEIVKRIRPRSNGRFRVRLKAPADGLAATYRLHTRVPGRKTGRRMYPTYTLPRYVTRGRTL